MEFKELKQKVDEAVKVWEEKRFLGKRDRLLNTAWRHGIVGIENPLEPKSEVYYKKNQDYIEKQH